MTPAPQKPTPNDHKAANRHIGNCLVYHQVLVAFAKTALFHVDNDFDSISATIAAASMPNIVSQAIHSDGVSSAKDKVVFCCREWLAICEEKENGAVTTDVIKYATVVLHLQKSNFVS